MDATPQCLRLTTKKINTIHPHDARHTLDQHTHTLAGLHLDRGPSSLNVHLFESSLDFVRLQQELFYVPNWAA